MSKLKSNDSVTCYKSLYLSPLFLYTFFFCHRILTGSFDKSVKIWTADGKPVHKLDNFISTVSGICYVPRNKTVWVAGGTSYASLFDPKSGDNVSTCFLADNIGHDSKVYFVASK